ncbi:MAG TPA: ABC transporter permease [Anaerolineae bacterium]|nr:ABC transporter permease [Anaerolineae bacterium]
MRLVSIFLKSLKEQIRDPLTLSLSLAFAPFFVLLYGLFFPSESTAYSLLVLNHDAGAQIVDGSRQDYGEEILRAMAELAYADERQMLEIEIVDDRASAEQRLRDRDADALLVLPEALSQTIWEASQGRETAIAEVIFIGDLTSPKYLVAAVMANAVLDEHIHEATAQVRPITITEIPLGASAERSEFEIYVPGLIIFAVVMLIFQASMTIAREIESGTLRRLEFSRMKAFDYIGGTTLALLAIALIQVLLTFFTAEALNFRSQGALWLAVLIGALTALSIIGAGMIVACLSKSVSQAFIIANFPMALFMFFSGAIYPVHNPTLFTIGERTIGIFDTIPATHAVVAMNKVFTLGAGLGEIGYELGMLLMLSLLYFVAGIWLFRQTQLKSK